MNRILTSAIALSCLFLCVANGFAQTETSGGQRIVGDVVKPVPDNAFYAPAGIPSPNGLDYLLYVQGDENLLDGSASLDKVILYTAPYTWDGLTNHFNYSKTILPDLTQGFPATTLYGHPAVFKASGKYYLTSLKSSTDHDFDEQLWGVSTDGYNYAFDSVNSLLRYTGHDDEQVHTGNSDERTWGWPVMIPGVTLRGPITLGGQQYYWGFTDLHTRVPIDYCTDNPAGPPPAFQPSCGTVENPLPDGLRDDPYWRTHSAPALRDGLGAILVQVDQSAKGYSTVKLWAGGQWQAVNPNGSFDFIPDVIYDFVAKPKLHWLNNGWEVWVNTSGNANCTGASDPCARSGAFYDNGISYILTNPPVNASSPPTFGSIYDISSDIRCMPGPHHNSRPYPFRVEGTNLLYSSSLDQYCNEPGFSAGYGGIQIVVTALEILSR